MCYLFPQAEKMAFSHTIFTFFLFFFIFFIQGKSIFTFPRGFLLGSQCRRMWYSLCLPSLFIIAETCHFYFWWILYLILFSKICLKILAICRFYKQSSSKTFTWDKLTTGKKKGLECKCSNRHFVIMTNKQKSVWTATGIQNMGCPSFLSVLNLMRSLALQT